MGCRWDFGPSLLAYWSMCRNYGCALRTGGAGCAECEKGIAESGARCAGSAESARARSGTAGGGWDPRAFGAQQGRPDYRRESKRLLAVHRSPLVTGRSYRLSDSPFPLTVVRTPPPVGSRQEMRAQPHIHRRSRARRFVCVAPLTSRKTEKPKPSLISSILPRVAARVRNLTFGAQNSPWGQLID